MATNLGNIISSSGNLTATINQSGQDAESNKVLITSGATLTYTWPSNGTSYFNGTSVSNVNGQMTWTTKWQHNHNTLGSVDTNPTVSASKSTGLANTGESITLSANNKLISGTTDTRATRAANIEYTVSYKGLSASFNSMDVSPRGVYQSAFNYPEPTIFTYASSDSDWLSVSPSVTERTGTDINTASTFTVKVAENIPSLSGEISGTTSIEGLPSTKDAVQGTGTIKANILDYVKDVDDSSAVAAERSGTITFKYDVYNSSTSISGTKTQTITQSGGEIEIPDPLYDYNWKSDSSWLTLANSTGESNIFTVSYNGGSVASVINPTVTVTYNDNISISGGQVTLNLIAGGTATNPVNTSSRTGTIELSTTSKSPYITNNITSSKGTVTQNGITHKNPTIKATVSGIQGVDSAIWSFNNSSWDKSLQFTIPGAQLQDSSAYIYGVDPKFTHTEFNATEYGSDLYDTNFYGLSTTAGYSNPVADEKYTFNVSIEAGEETAISGASASPSTFVVTRKGRNGSAWEYAQPTFTTGSIADSWINGTSNSVLGISNWPSASESSHSDRIFDSNSTLTLSTPFYPKSANTGTASILFSNKTFSSAAHTSESTNGPIINIQNSSTRTATIPITIGYKDSTGANRTATSSVSVSQKGSNGSATWSATSNQSWLTLSNNTDRTPDQVLGVTMSTGNTGTISGNVKTDTTGYGTSSTSGNVFNYPYSASGNALKLDLSGISFAQGASRSATVIATMNISDDLSATSKTASSTFTQQGLIPTINPYVSGTNSWFSVGTAFPSSISSGATASTIFSITPNYGTSTGSITGTVGITPSTFTNIPYTGGTGNSRTATGTLSNFSNTVVTKTSDPREITITYGFRYTNGNKSSDSGTIIIKQEGQTVEGVPSSITYSWTSDSSWLKFNSATNTNSTSIYADSNSPSSSGDIDWALNISPSSVNTIPYDGTTSNTRTLSAEVSEYNDTMQYNDTPDRTSKVTLTESMGDFWSNSATVSVTQNGQKAPRPGTMTYTWSSDSNWLQFNGSTNLQNANIYATDNSGSQTGSITGTPNISGSTSNVDILGETRSFTSSIQDFSNTIVTEDTNSRTGIISLVTEVSGFNTKTATRNITQAGHTWTKPSSITYSWTSPNSWISFGSVSSKNTSVIFASNAGSQTGTISGTVGISPSSSNISSGANSLSLTSTLSNFSNGVVTNNTSPRTGFVYLTEKIDGFWTPDTAKSSSISQPGSSYMAPGSITYTWSSNVSWATPTTTNSKTSTVSIGDNSATRTGTISGTTKIQNPVTSVSIDGTSITSVSGIVNSYSSTLTNKNTNQRTGTISCKESISWTKGTWESTGTSTIVQQGQSLPGLNSSKTYTWTSDSNWLTISNSSTNIPVFNIESNATASGSGTITGSTYTKPKYQVTSSNINITTQYIPNSISNNTYTYFVSYLMNYSDNYVINGGGTRTGTVSLNVKLSYTDGTLCKDFGTDTMTIIQPGNGSSIKKEMTYWARLVPADTDWVAMYDLKGNRVPESNSYLAIIQVIKRNVIEPAGSITGTAKIIGSNTNTSDWEEYEETFDSPAYVLEHDLYENTDYSTVSEWIDDNGFDQGEVKALEASIEGFSNTYSYTNTSPRYAYVYFGTYVRDPFDSSKYLFNQSYSPYIKQNGTSYHGPSSTMTYQWSIISGSDWMAIQGPDDEKVCYVADIISNRATYTGTISATVTCSADKTFTSTGSTTGTATASLTVSSDTISINNTNTLTGAIQLTTSISYDNSTTSKMWTSTTSYTLYKDGNTISKRITYSWVRSGNKEGTSATSTNWMTVSTSNNTLTYTITSRTLTNGAITAITFTQSPSATTFASTGGSLTVSVTSSNITSTDPTTVPEYSCYYTCYENIYVGNTQITRPYDSIWFKRYSATGTTPYMYIRPRLYWLNGSTATYISTPSSKQYTSTAITQSFSLTVPSGASTSTAGTTTIYNSDGYKFNTVSASASGGEYTIYVYNYKQTPGTTGVIPAATYYVALQKTSNRNGTGENLGSAITITRQGSSGTTDPAPTVNMDYTINSWAWIRSNTASSFSSSTNTGTVTMIYSSSSNKSVTNTSSATATALKIYCSSNEGTSSSWNSFPGGGTAIVPGSTTGTVTNNTSFVPTFTSGTVTSTRIGSISPTATTGEKTNAITITQSGSGDASILQYTVVSNTSGWSVVSSSVNGGTAWQYKSPAANTYYYHTTTTNNYSLSSVSNSGLSADSADATVTWGNDYYYWRLYVTINYTSTSSSPTSTIGSTLPITGEFTVTPSGQSAKTIFLTVNAVHGADTFSTNNVYPTITVTPSLSNTSYFEWYENGPTTISGGTTSWTAVWRGQGNAFSTQSNTMTVTFTSNGVSKSVSQTVTINALTWTAHNS